MANARRFSIYDITLAAGEGIDIIRLSNFVVCVTATAAFNLAIDDETPGRFEQGLSFESTQTFEKVRLENNSGASNTIRLGLGIGKLTDSRANFTSALSLVKAATPDSIADVALPAAATTVIQAADTTRREIIISNPVTNTKTFRIGDAGAGAANGIPLEPGASIVLSTSGAVYGFNPAGAVESVCVLLVKD